MLKIRFPSNYNQRAGVNRLLLKYGRGLTLKDKLSFSVLKISYLGLWLTTHLIPREKKRKNKLYKIEFRDLMSKFVGPNNMIECEVPKYGYKSYCRTDNSFNDLVIMTKHEDDLLQLFCPTKEDIVVDIGAYLGRYTLTSSNLVGESGRVVAIEGDPSHYEILKKNLKLNKVSNVTAINCMVGSKDMHLIIGSEGNYLTVSSKNDMHTNYQENSYREFDETGRAQIDNTIVHLNTLDNLLIKEHGISEVNWMKIDVEGAELEVLKSAHNILSNSKRIKLLIEIHDVNKLYKPIVELLDSYNFKIIFEKDEQRYRSGAKHIIAKKIDR
ncbi:MAG TPA: FkbM family methyltransferase [Nitrososphaeraceae archaeon]|nr:FkbM family methyltransferase [Nitrososphaeraceae archaeon]